MKVGVAGVAGGSVPIQNIVEAIAAVVADTDDTAGNRGRAKAMPGVAVIMIAKLL